MSRLSFQLRREWLSLMLLSLLGALVLNCFYGPLGPRDLFVLRHHRASITTVRDRLAAENAHLKQQIVRLRSDDAYIQRLIRQELGYARSEDYVYRFAGSKAHPVR